MYVANSPVHPRVHGEHELLRRNGGNFCGSSPRARGTLVEVSPYGVNLRFIPACTGNTTLCSLHPPCHSVHPRVRGEHPVLRMVSAALNGSSPRARGTRSSQRTLSINLRFIPACAGNTRCSGATRCAQSVHPRVRGEHGEQYVGPLLSTGSSPRARGTRNANRRKVRERRFIPACAGNTMCTPCAGLMLAVHPRVRGEHERYQTGCRPYDRFIPACAGNTEPQKNDGPYYSVHPRVRGEHLAAFAALVAAFGSSPRARGTRYEFRDTGINDRFIPACAGNTPRSRSRS